MFVLLSSAPFIQAHTVATKDGVQYCIGPDGLSYLHKGNMRRISREAGTCIVVFNDMIVTGHDGHIRSREKKRCRHVTAVAGKIVDLSASDSICIAATAQGLLYLSRDAKEWKMTDFNAQYSQYYGEIAVRCVCSSRAGLMLAGILDDGSPVAFESDRGGVWSPRELTYNEGGSILTLQERPLSLVYDYEHERYEMACTGGVTFLLPGCSHCNALIKTQ